jgi:hypothetical protein
MYGLPQAGILANQLLTKRLEPHGYYQCRHTPGLWRHKWRPVLFSLVVDDFGIKYVGREHINHLIDDIEEHYEFSKDWEGRLYCGITLKWDYDERTCDLSMPGYLRAAIHHFQHPHPALEQHSPNKWIEPTYGAHQQLTAPMDDTEPLTPDLIKQVQRVTGTLLFSARAVDSTMLIALGTIAEQQTNGTEATARAVVHLLDYCVTHPDATIRYRASGMILWIHSNASHLSASKARSRAGGHFFLGNKPYNQPEGGNGAILNTATIMGNTPSSAAEAECGAMFNNTKMTVALRNTLKEMGHEQPPTPLQVDDSMAVGFANK